MIMDLLRLVFGWNWRVRRLRKNWDRTREKTLKKKAQIRKPALEKLDAIENNLRMLEEQSLNRFAKAKLSKDIEINLAGVKEFIKSKPEELAAAGQAKQPMRS
jgi:hypothetical protein